MMTKQIYVVTENNHDGIVRTVRAYENKHDAEDFVYCCEHYATNWPSPNHLFSTRDAEEKVWKGNHPDPLIEHTNSYYDVNEITLED